MVGVVATKQAGLREAVGLCTMFCVAEATANNNWKATGLDKIDAQVIANFQRRMTW